jgi:hypothetical protein
MGSGSGFLAEQLVSTFRAKTFPAITENANQQGSMLLSQFSAIFANFHGFFLT